MIIWLGIDELPKFALIFLACFAPLALSALPEILVGMRTDIVVIGIIVIGVVAYAFDALMRLLERKLVPWKGR